MYQQDLLRDFEFRMSDIDRILLEMEKRGQEYFDDTMRLGRVMDLLNRSRMQQGFEHQVIADAPQQIERKVGELVDWLVDADLRQWQDVTRHLAQRRRQYRGSNRRRRRLRPLQLRSHPAARCGRAASRSARSSPTIGGKRRATWPTAHAMRSRRRRAVSAGALGLGAIVTLAATTTAADVTGIMMASLLAALGFFILPAKRETGRSRRCAGRLRPCGSGSPMPCTSSSRREIAKSGERILESIAPYSRFVRAEGEKLRTTEQELGEIGAILASLQARIERPAA